MNFGGRDNRDGNKRKYQWPGYNSGAKRFHGPSNSPREELHRGGGSRWDRGSSHHERETFSKSHRAPGSWGNRERSNYNRFPQPVNNKNYNQLFDLQPPASSGPSKESEELIGGPGSDVERMEKVLATKKRIEEALASKSSNSNNKEINFQNSSTNVLDKTKDKDSHGPNLDIRLTNSDFREIGSVASAVPTEGEIDVTDYTTNAPSDITAHTSQQRSFDNTTLNPPTNTQVPQQRPQKVGGWSMSAVNNIVPEQNKSGPSPRHRNDMYLQEAREEILGNISTVANENTVDPSINKPSNENQNYKDDFARVGRLYHSFLKSRLYGYTLKLRDKSQRLPGLSNPLLDKSVLDRTNYSSNKPGLENQVLEIEVHQPISVKPENNETNAEITPEHIAAEEANEFCNEFSYLLKDPNFLIPPEDLEKLGLGHLSEMNKLINDKRSGNISASQCPAENIDRLLLRNSGDNNTSTRDEDINREASPFNRPTSYNIGQNEIVDRLKERDRLRSNGVLHNESISPQGTQNSYPLDQTLPFQNVTVEAVEAVVEKAIKKLIQPSSNNSINSSIPSTTGDFTNLTTVPNESDSTGEAGTSFSNTKNIPSNQMQDVISKILRLFLIDKQIEDLMAEKMKIYSDLLSTQGISEPLFHSWAQDQIHQGNVMKVISNTSNVVPELFKVINRTTQEAFPLQTNNAQLYPDNTIDETISELYSLKKEYGNPDLSVPQPTESNSQQPNVLPPDSCFITPTPTAVEENRPKLSVRKDLLDPNRTNVSLLNTPTVSTEDISNISDCTNTADTDKTNIKKKKKKSKKKDSVEVINLIEDTDDEISSGTGMDSVATDDVPLKNRLNSENEIEKKDTPQLNMRLSYDLDAKSATCMTIMKVKKIPTKVVMVVGCKDGSVMGYALGHPTINFTKKIHDDTITAIYYIHKYLITGSTDSTVCLFSLKEQVATQTLSLNAQVQSMDMNSKQLVVGTKAGSIYSYVIKVGENWEMKKFVSLHPISSRPLSITNSSILAVKLAKEGVRQVLIVASRGEQITVRDSTSGLLLRTFDWCDTVFCLQLYEETPLVYCGTNTKSVKVVNYIDGENMWDCITGRSITQIVFLQSLMFAASHDGNIYVYDVEKRSLMATVIISKGIIQCLAVDGKNSVILVASNRGDLQQIPFPVSVTKHLKRIKMGKKKDQTKNPTQT